MATKSNKQEAKWAVLAEALPTDQYQVTVPIRAYVVEALAAADFLEANWATTFIPKTKAVARLGLETAGKKLSKSVAAEIRALVPIVTQANYDAERAADPKSPTAAAVARGRAIVEEITATLTWYFDDGVEDWKDAELAAIEAAHKDDPMTADAIALELEDFVRLATPHVKEITGLGGFDPKVLDEALVVAKTLRAAPLVPGFTTSPATRAALGTRNRYLQLLQERVDRVRKAARFVYRDQPGALPADVMGGYVARRKVLAKRSATRKANAQPKPVPPVAVPTNGGAHPQ